MTIDQLKQQLEQLHQTLSDHPQLNDEQRELLQKIADDIQAVEPQLDSPDLSDRVQQQAIEFEHEHPTLATVLRQIVDTLGRMGV
ncbi:MAG: DUF4404 family protein [Bacterioplanes sp.]|nr:DUF4404 family protein [Bacterioplanes sp.]